MIAISSAVSSSISSISAGIVSSPARRDARQRRSPATIWYVFGPSGRTRMGWRTPCSRIEAASSSSACGSKTIRGCSGFGSMWSTWTMRTPIDLVGLSGVSRLTIAGESSVSSDRRRAAAARKSVRGKFDHLPGKVAINTCRIAAACVRRDRTPDQRSLSELHGVSDDAGEDMVVADDLQLFEHVLREIRSAVEECRQQSEDPQIPVQLEADRVDDLDQVVEALHRVVLRLDRDDHSGRRDKSVDRQHAEVWRAIDEDVVIRRDVPLECVAQDRLPAKCREQFTLRRSEIDVGGCDIDAGCLRRQDHLGEGRSSVSENVSHGTFDGIQVDAEAGSEVGLRIHVDAEDAVALFSERARKIDRRRRLSDAALLVGDR